jgi:hypothetical protein
VISTQTTIARVATATGAVFFLLFGGWAFLDPSSFYDRIASWPPYNQHLTRDAGAFQVGIGVSLAAVLFGMKGIPAVLAGAATAAILHAVSHVIDYGDGGRSSDPYILGIVALLLLFAFGLEKRSAR